jgi:hypothetical protein
VVICGGIRKVIFKDGKPNDLVEMYHENGQLLLKGTFKDGKPNDLVEMYHENGQLLLKGTFKDGELNGSSEMYSENGQLKQSTTYNFPEIDLMSGFMFPSLEEPEEPVSSLLNKPSQGVYKSRGEVITFKSFSSTDIGITDSSGCTLDVMTQDLGEMSWKDITEYCENLKGGWRLPNLTELILLEKYRDEIGGFSSEVYWSDMDNDAGQVMVLDFGEIEYGPVVVSKDRLCYVRIVRGKYTKSSPPPPPPPSPIFIRE